MYMKYSLDTKIKDLAADMKVMEKVNELFPGVVNDSIISMVGSQSLKQASYLAPHILTDEKLKLLADFLEGLGE